MDMNKVNQFITIIGLRQTILADLSPIYMVLKQYIQQVLKQL